VLRTAGDRAGSPRRGSAAGVPVSPRLPDMPGEVSGILLVAAFATVAALCGLLAARLLGLSSAGKKR